MKRKGGEEEGRRKRRRRKRGKSKRERRGRRGRKSKQMQWHRPIVPALRKLSGRIMSSRTA